MLKKRKAPKCNHICIEIRPTDRYYLDLHNGTCLHLLDSKIIRLHKTQMSLYSGPQAWLLNCTERHHSGGYFMASTASRDPLKTPL